VLISTLVGLLSLVLAALLRSRLLFAIATICWVQNLLLPWWYTQRWIDVPTARALLLLKELLLLFLVLYTAWRARWVWRRTLPAPVVWALVYGTWSLVRIGLGVTVGGEPLVENLRLVRSVLFPIEAVVATFLVGILAPDLGVRYLRFTIVGLTICAAVSLGLYFLPSDTFWLNQVNIALYNVNVKGDPEWTVLSELGISGSSAGRSVFEALSAFRLFGTFGDPLTAGMALGLALLGVSAPRRVAPGTMAAAAVLAAALFLTFSRSAWVLVAVGFVYLSIVQRRGWRLAFIVAVFAALWLWLSPLREFVALSLGAFAFETADVYHAQGIVNFYSTGMLNLVYLLGTGPLDTSAQSWVLENGLAYLTVQFGLPLLIAFIGLCLSAERYLRRRTLREDTLARLGGVCALASLVVANFSFYALSFTAYFGIWSVVGLAVGTAHRRELEVVAEGPVAGVGPQEAGA